MRKDEKHALECLTNAGLLFKHISKLVLHHPFSEWQYGDKDATQLQGDRFWVVVDPKHEDDVEAWEERWL